MTKILEITEFTPASGNEYNPSAYPGPGLYIGNYCGTRSLIVVSSCVTTCPAAGLEVKELPEPPKQLPAPTGISEATFLKALALAHGTKAETLNLNEAKS